MRFIFGIALVIFSFGVLSVGDKAPEAQYFSQLTVPGQAETIDVFLLDFSDFFSSKFRVRNSSPYQQRIKNERSFEFLQLPGLVFLSCKLSKAYSEIEIHHYLKFLFQYTIQVNAP
jgi:hypothetical protein